MDGDVHHDRIATSKHVVKVERNDNKSSRGL